MLATLSTAFSTALTPDGLAVVVAVVAPVFCLVALGYICAATGLLSQETGDGVTAYVFTIGVPVLLMRAIATAEFSGASPWVFWGTYFSGIAVVWTLATFVVRRFFARGWGASTIAGIAAAFSNIVLFGVPMVERAYGHAGLQVLFLLVAVHLPILLTVTTFAMEFAVRADGATETSLRPLDIARHLVSSLSHNPIVIGLLVGLAWRLLQPPVWTPIAAVGVETIDLLARTTGPLALFALGMGAVKYGLRGNVGPALWLAVLALIGLPAIVWTVALQTGLPPLWVKVAVLAAACPTGVNAYLFATYFKTGEGLATNTICLTMFGALITVPLWLALLG